MLRVLVAVEDFGEMVYLQILLSKLGFDVGTVKNPKVLNDSLYKMNPDFVILTARRKRVIGVELAKQTKKIMPKAKILLLASPQIREKLTNSEIMYAEAVLETPVNPPALLDIMARLSGLNVDTLMDKYKKMKATLPTLGDASMMVQGDAGVEIPETMSVTGSTQESRYKKFLKLDEEPKVHSFNKQKVVEIVKEIRTETRDEDLEKERVSFVNALFKKKA
jgi:response regulator RpfG family c-di-GMP phosphodiesterase